MAGLMADEAPLGAWVVVWVICGLAVLGSYADSVAGTIRKARRTRQKDAAPAPLKL
jgi:hypothetical protein